MTREMGGRGEERKGPFMPESTASCPQGDWLAHLAAAGKRGQLPRQRSQQGALSCPDFPNDDGKLAPGYGQ